MSFTRKILVSMIAVALVPPLLVMAVIYFHSRAQAEEIERRDAQAEIDKYPRFRQSYEQSIRQAVAQQIGSPNFSRAVLLYKAGRIDQVTLPEQTPGLDFFELLDSSNAVVASAGRPGMVGERISRPAQPAGDITFVRSVEYNLHGQHPAIAILAPVDSVLSVYAGRYLDSNFINSLAGTVDAQVAIQPAAQAGLDSAIYTQMQPGTIYAEPNRFRAVLDGGPQAGYYVTAAIDAGSQRPVFASLIRVTGLVAAVSTLLALAVSLFIARKARREINNLIDATERVAGGDLTTPVMAFESGEFAQLADSFSDMTRKLRLSQEHLAASEKIAAWQVMGRKLAHEIKNPLTPIAICADDLRRSYHEQLPEFGQVLERNTLMIRSEVHRLAQLLDQFASFARMAPPQKRDADLRRRLDEIADLYQSEIAVGRLTLANHASPGTFRLDPEQVKQLLINLIKNGLESAETASVAVTLQNEQDSLKITVEDTGPGFSEEKLRRGFEPYLSSKKDGSGLGLVISERIAVDHGGTITLANRSEGGAVVTVTLPSM